MKLVLTALLSSAAVFAVLCQTPALAGNGNDPRFEADQAQIHPWAADQSPDWSPHDVAVGELYPKVSGVQAFYGPNGERPLGAMNAVTRSCPVVLDTTNGRETVVCGP